MRPYLLLVAATLLLSNSGLAQDSLYVPEDPLREGLPDIGIPFGESGKTPDLSATTEGEEKVSRTHSVPVASRGNTIELEVVNTTDAVLRNVELTVSGVPEWMQIDPERDILKLPPGAGTTVRFTFHLSDEALIGEKADLMVTARNQQNYIWNKQFSLKVKAPSKFGLDQNYPNPFTSSTTITYRLPEQMQVRVTIYDLLGRRVAVLVDELQEAGSQTLSWDAAGRASGVYFYRVEARDSDGKQVSENKKMVLIR